MSGLTADVDFGDVTQFWGKTPADLQSDIEIDGTNISGILNYIDDYSSAFSGDEASGNYIALHFSVPDVDDVTLTATITNPVTLDPDGILVGRIRDKDSQTITVVASKEGYESVTQVYDLSGLICDDGDDT